MVSEVVEAPAVVEAPIEADQTPVEQQTEIAEETPDAAAPAQEEAAAPEQLEGEERRYTQAELNQMAQRVAAETIEHDRRQRQSEGARRAQEAERATKEKADLREAVEVALYKSGGDTESALDAIVEKVAGKQQNFSVERAQADMERAMAWVTAPLRGDNTPYEEYGMTPAANAFAAAVLPYLEQVMGTTSRAAVQGYIPESEIPARVKAEIARQNAKAREGKTELRLPEGSPSMNTNTLEYWEQRVAHQGEDNYPMLNTSEWDSYRQVRKDNGL